MADHWHLAVFSPPSSPSTRSAREGVDDSNCRRLLLLCLALPRAPPTSFGLGPSCTHSFLRPFRVQNSMIQFVLFGVLVAFQPTCAVAFTQLFVAEVRNASFAICEPNRYEYELFPSIPGLCRVQR